MSPEWLGLGVKEFVALVSWVFIIILLGYLYRQVTK